jgi:hypothetical protein
MQFLHAPAKTHAAFDDEHLIAYAGLVPVMRLAERCDLSGLVDQHVRIADRLGVNAPLKIGSIVAGMATGADSIDDLDVLRHGGMTKLFGGVRAPSTLGSFLRALAWGNVRQIEKVSGLMLARLAGHAPLLAGADTLAFLDVDAAGRAGGGRHEIARRHRELRSRRGLVCGRSDQHRPIRGVFGPVDRARRLGLLQRRVRRRVPARGRELLGHRHHGPQDQGRDRGHPRG